MKPNNSNGIGARSARLLRLVRLQEARPDLPPATLFHAGPPYRGAPPRAVQTAAAQAAVIGDMAHNFESALQRLSDGTLSLRPAQDFGLAAPLAQVIAPAMWCFEVGDTQDKAYAPVSEGGAPALRFGASDAACVERARVWCGDVASALNSVVKDLPEPVALMREALDLGDECHAVTAAGNQLFVNALAGLDPAIAAGILANPGFVLPLWMAWSSWAVKASGHHIAAIGGNGQDFGVRLRGAERWTIAPAEVPIGHYFKPEMQHLALGAIGDSALVDICGYGGQALGHAPVLLKEWADRIPADALSRAERIVDPVLGMVDRERVIATGTVPTIHLAILNLEGAGAPIGRGYYHPPISLFQLGD